jgi:hypothetical protein
MVENIEETNDEQLIFFDTFSHDLHEVIFLQNAINMKHLTFLLSFIAETELGLSSISKSSVHYGNSNNSSGISSAGLLSGRWESIGRNKSLSI